MEGRRHNRRYGYSLIEMIVSIGIFAVMLISITAIFRQVLLSQQYAIAAKNTRESLSFSFEVMSKELRFAQRQDNTCEDMVDLAGFTAVVATNKVYNTAEAGSVLYFKNRTGECVIYYSRMDPNGSRRLRVARDIDPSDGNLDYDLDFTPDEVTVSGLTFLAVDDLIGATPVTTQARVTFRLGVRSRDVREFAEQDFAMQTTISSRYYEGN